MAALAFAAGSAMAQDAAAELIVRDFGGDGRQFSARIQVEGDSGSAVEFLYTNAASEPVELEPGNYVVTPVPVQTHGYIGWALGTDGSCPMQPTRTDAQIPVRLTGEATTLLCLYHRAGAPDVSGLEEAASPTLTPAARATPQAPATGTGINRSESRGTRAFGIALLALIVSGAGWLALSRRR